MITRRVFLKLTTAASAIGALIPVRFAEAAKVGLPLDKAPDLKKVGGSAVLKIKDREILFFRQDETTVKAMSAICTHKKCKVRYLHDDKKIGCKCHKSHYNLDGVNVDGPAPKPLEVFPAELSGEKIIITLP